MPPSAPSSVLAHGPVRCALLPLARGTPAEPLAQSWLAEALGCAASALGLHRDARGRPQFDPPGWDCNWSHSGGWLAVALMRGGRVGVDIERRHPRPRSLEIAERYFDAREAAALARLPASERGDAFLQLWCAKEAVLKAHGHGLAFGLDRLRFDDNDGRGALRLAECDPALGDVATWTLQRFDVPDGLGMLAWQTAASEVQSR